MKTMSSLPQRWLPPGNLRMLFHQWGRKDISYQQFWRTYNEQWRTLLKFLPPSTHGTCDDCTHYKELFRTTPVKDLQARFDVAKAYREHVDQVGDDRALEDWVQAQNPFLNQQDAMTMHVDGMDQAKWAIPRCRNSTTTKAEMPLQKPRFKIQGCWQTIV